MNQKTKKIILLIVMVSLGYFAVSLLSKDSYVGFFYPDAGNLTVDIMSEEKFETLSECRAWAETMALEHYEKVTSHENGYDYECGLNCDLSGGKPYVCDEALQ